MNIFIVYRENAYQGFEVRKIFSSLKAAKAFIDNEPQYEHPLLSIVENFVEFDETS